MIWVLLGAIALLALVLVNALTTNPDKPRDFDSNWWRANQSGCLLILLLGAVGFVLLLLVVL